MNNERSNNIIAKSSVERSAEQLDSLTSCRFVAAMAVVLFHSGSTAIASSSFMPIFIKNVISNGYIGVSFFFVLSGFILAYVYYSKINEYDFVYSFFSARVARIYPVYFGSTLFAAIFIDKFSLATDWQQFILVQTWIDWASEARSWNFPAWTLSVEAFFYLTFPFLLGILVKLRLHALSLLMIALAVYISATGYWGAFGGVVDARIQLLPLPLLRYPEFLYGVCIGIIFCRGYRLYSPYLLAAALLLEVYVLASGKSSFAPTASVLIVGPIVYLIACSGGKNRLSILRSRVLVLLGGASYAIYLLHVPLSSLRNVLFASNEVVGKVVYYPIVIALSVLIYLFYEEPARLFIKRASRRLFLKLKEA
ncbi:acyltransferase [Mesorhizobium sp. M0060]|uniref:acyltransferase family protein n=1 Tax=Mesorhizobium sp. M0060 TaxID=2956866 RepID=UPI00333AF5E1